MSNQISKLNPGRWSRKLQLMILAVLILLVVGSVLFASQSNNNGDVAVEPIEGDRPTEVYNPCTDDDIPKDDKPFTCFTSVSYSLDFLQRHRSRPDRCWIAVDGFAYDITPGDKSYEYPGPGPIDNLCGQDASERFRLDSVAPPDQEYLKGSVRS